MEEQIKPLIEKYGQKAISAKHRMISASESGDKITVEICNMKYIVCTNIIADLKKLQLLNQ